MKRNLTIALVLALVCAAPLAAQLRLEAGADIAYVPADSLWSSLYPLPMAAARYTWDLGSAAVGVGMRASLGILGATIEAELPLGLLTLEAQAGCGLDVIMFVVGGWSSAALIFGDLSAWYNWNILRFGIGIIGRTNPAYWPDSKAHSIMPYLGARVSILF